MTTAKAKQNLTVIVVDVAKGIETIRDLNSDELAQLKIDETQAMAKQAEIDTKAAARASALAKLAALGLTADEIASL